MTWHGLAGLAPPETDRSIDRTRALTAPHCSVQLQGRWRRAHYRAVPELRQLQRPRHEALVCARLPTYLPTILQTKPNQPKPPIRPAPPHLQTPHPTPSALSVGPFFHPPKLTHLSFSQGMVHLLLRAPDPLLAQAVQGSRLPRLQLPPGHQVPPGCAAADWRRRGRPAARRHDARRPAGRIWRPTERSPAVQVRRRKQCLAD
jgi:hypothetical protein